MRISDWSSDVCSSDLSADDRLVALAPAADVPLRWLHYPDAAPVQAAAAARIDALKDSLGDAALLHVVAGQPAGEGQAVPVAVTTHAVMAAWTDRKSTRLNSRH